MQQTISFRKIRESQEYQKCLESYTASFKPKDDYEAMLVGKIAFAVIAQLYAEDYIELDYWDRMHFRAANHLRQIRRDGLVSTRYSNHPRARYAYAPQAEAQPQPQAEEPPQEDLSLLSIAEIKERIEQLSQPTGEEEDYSHLSNAELMAKIFDIVNPIEDRPKNRRQNPYRPAHSPRPVHKPPQQNIMGPATSGNPPLPQQMGSQPQPPVEPQKTEPDNQNHPENPNPTHDNPNEEHPNQDKPPPPE